MLAIFHQLGCEIMSQSASALHAIPMGNHYWQLLMKKIILQVFYHSGHAFHAHAFGNSNFEILIFLKIELVIHLENDCIWIVSHSLSISVFILAPYCTKQELSVLCRQGHLTFKRTAIFRLLIGLVKRVFFQ